MKRAALVWVAGHSDRFPICVGPNSVERLPLDRTPGFLTASPAVCCFAMRKTAACLFLLLFPAALCAQTADIAYFRAVMLPSNEVPATTAQATGIADIVVHMVRDSSGQVTNGTVDFLVRANFAADTMATGLHIHSGAAGVAGPVVIGTSLSAGAPQALKADGDTVRLPVQITGESSALSALRDLLVNPRQYYVNIHTPDFPGGAIRGQLAPAIGTVLMGQMSAANETPPVTNATATGTAVVVALATLDANNAPLSGEVYMECTYDISDRGTFTGFHIHPGTAGNAGPAALPSSMPAGTPIDPSGAGLVGPFYTEINLANAVQVATFANLFLNPAGDYINIHTNTHGGGVMRAQLRPTDNMAFHVMMDSANETGAVTGKGTAPAIVTLHTIRNEDGSVAGGTVFFDINYRFGGPTQFTGLHIHDAGAGVNGPVSIPMVPTYDAAFSSATGFGNYWNWTPGVANLATLTDVITNPENHYVNIHTSTDGGGAARSQLAPVVSAVGTVNAVIAANLDKNATTVAPGGLISIFGTNLVKTAADLSGWVGKTLPSSLNGTNVTIGGEAAPLLYVSPTQLNAQVPVDMAPGQKNVVVTSVVGPSASFPVTVAAVAPAIFFAPVAAVLKNTDYSLVTASNPAHAGDVILVYLTGMGQTTPAIATGGLVPTGVVANTSTVTATVGGQDAAVAYSIASPGYAGLYQVALTIPTGVTGSTPVVLTQGSIKSNTIQIPVQ